MFVTLTEIQIFESAEKNSKVCGAVCFSVNVLQIKLGILCEFDQKLLLGGKSLQKLLLPCFYKSIYIEMSGFEHIWNPSQQLHVHPT